MALKKRGGKKKKTIAHEKKTPAPAVHNQKELENEAVKLLVQIIRGELIEMDDKDLKPPTIAQRLNAAQALLKIKDLVAPESEKPNAGSMVDIPERSVTFAEWLQRGADMQKVKSGE